MAPEPMEPAIVQWRELRREAFDEQTLISHRTGWLLTTQGLFFAAFAVLLAANFKVFWWLPCLFLPLVGIVVSIMAYYPIRAAADTIEYWLTKERHFIDAHPGLRPLTLADRQPEIHYRSMRWPQQLPALFVVMWVLLSGMTLLQAWLGIIPELP